MPARPKRVADEAAAVESETRKLAAELAPSVRSVTIPVRGLMLLLSAAVVVAVLLSLVQDLLIFLAPEAGFTDRIYRLDLDTEASLPTWLSSCLMLVCSLRSEEHTSELQSLMRSSYAVFCLKKKNSTTY